MKFESYVMPNKLIEPDKLIAMGGELDWDGFYYRIGWQFMAGYDMERVNIRTRDDDANLILAIARIDGKVVAVTTQVRAGPKEWGWE